MSFILNFIREYLRDMSKNPLEKIEETLDISTLIWMLLYGSFPYPSAQQQIEEQLGNIDREIEENPEQAKQGFTWLYRIGNVYRLIHVQPVWINDLLNYTIRLLETKSVIDYLKVFDSLDYRTSNKSVTRMPESIRLYDSINYLTSLRIQQLFTEYVNVADAIEHYIRSLTQSVLAESITITDALNIISKTKTISQYSETLTLSDELSSESFPAPQALTLFFSETIKLSDTRIEGYPYPEQPEISYMRYGLADSIHFLDGLEISTLVYELFATKYDGYTEVGTIYNWFSIKYDGYTESETIYNWFSIKYDGYIMSSVSIS